MVDPSWLRATLSQNPAWSKLATYKEVPIVAELLLPGDQILDVGHGLYEDHLGLVLITSNRVLFGGRKMPSLMKHTKTEIFDVHKITSVQVNASAFLSTLIIVTSGAKGEIKSMATPDCKRIADCLRYLLSKQHTAPPVQQPVSPVPPIKPPPSIADELRKLAELHSTGLITESEFAQAKSKLLT
jgi:hypothetical protein